MYRTFKRADGSVAVMIFATADPKLITRDTENFLAGHGGAVVVGDDLPLPKDRRWRNQWTADERGVFVDMAKARVKRLDEIRTERDARLDASDKEMLRAQETGGDTRALAARRQKLRDVPQVVGPQIDRIGDPDALAAFEPEWGDAA